MKEISLTQGKVALVDDEDYEWLLQWTWYADKRKHTYYAIRAPWNESSVGMHREIMGIVGDDKRWVDHRNNNGLDNRRQNLRICTPQQNRMNARGKGGTSQYKGVFWSKHANKWGVQICINGGKKNLGYFDLEEEAAKIYNEAAMELFGEFAYLNKIDNPELLEGK